MTRTERLLARKNYKWIVVALLFVCGFLNLEDRVVIFSIVPLIRRDLHLTDVQTGALMTAFLWTYAAFSPFTSYFGDRMSRRWVVLWSVCAWSVVTLWAGAITSTGQLFTTRLMLGFTESFYLPAAMALLADWHGRRTRARAVSTLIIGMNLGPILGGAFAGYVGENYGWRVVLYVLGAIGVVHTFLLILFLREAPPGAAETDGVVSETPVPAQPKPAFCMCCARWYRYRRSSVSASSAVSMLFPSTCWLHGFPSSCMTPSRSVLPNRPFWATSFSWRR